MSQGQPQYFPPPTAEWNPAWVPELIEEQSILTPTQRAVLQAVRAFQWREKDGRRRGCSASNATLGAAIRTAPLSESPEDPKGLHEDTVSKAIGQLALLGLVQVQAVPRTRFNMTGRVLFARFPPPQQRQALVLEFFEEHGIPLTEAQRERILAAAAAPSCTPEGQLEMNIPRPKERRRQAGPDDRVGRASWTAPAGAPATPPAAPSSPPPSASPSTTPPPPEVVSPTSTACTSAQVRSEARGGSDLGTGQIRGEIKDPHTPTDVGSTPGPAPDPGTGPRCVVEDDRDLTGLEYEVRHFGADKVRGILGALRQQYAGREHTIRSFVALCKQALRQGYQFGRAPAATPAAAPTPRVEPRHDPQREDGYYRDVEDLLQTLRAGGPVPGLLGPITRDQIGQELRHPALAAEVARRLGLVEVGRLTMELLTRRPS